MIRAPSLSTHVVDTELGKPARGVPVTLGRLDHDSFTVVGQGITNAGGRIADLLDEALIAVASAPGAGGVSDPEAGYVVSSRDSAMREKALFILGPYRPRDSQGAPRRSARARSVRGGRVLFWPLAWGPLCHGAVETLLGVYPGAAPCVLTYTA